jgi:hypothetical protein
MENDKSMLYIVAIVAIVAVVALVMMVMFRPVFSEANGSAVSVATPADTVADSTGQAYAKPVNYNGYTAAYVKCNYGYSFNITFVSAQTLVGVNCATPSDMAYGGPSYCRVRGATYNSMTPAGNQCVATIVI